MIFRRIALLWMILAACASAQVAREPEEAYPNYDIRDAENAGALAGVRAQVKTNPASKIVGAMAKARNSLAARIPGVRMEMNRFGAPEILGTDSASQFLAAPSAQSQIEVARRVLIDNAAIYGLTREQVTGLVKVADYANPAGNMSWVKFRQESNGMPIFQAEMQAAFSRKGALMRLTGNLVPALDYPSLATNPKISKSEAAVRAAATIGRTIDGNESNSPNVFTQPVRPELVYFPLESGAATLAYWMILWDQPDAYYVVVDATDGALLWRKDITDHQTQTATYRVYLDDSPGPLSPTNVLPGEGTQAPGISRTTVTLVGNEPPNTFNNLGWITDGGNATSGNNVDCGLDVSFPGGIDTTGRANGSPTRVFDFSYNPPPLGSDSPAGASYRNGIVTNLFYWTNVYHDRLYLLGFTEAAGNFQNNNFGRGGLQSDAVSAQAQDFSGSNNANFSTPPDGSDGIMQMYLFNHPSPQRDGSIDSEVFLHELTHGLSNRLHNNGSGLTSREASGMGEGWSDFYARCLLSSADEDRNGIFAFGAYVTLQLSGTFNDNYYYGIRRFPYAVRTNLGANGKPHNPFTYGDIDFVKINMYRGAYAPSAAIGITANEVHNIGTVWCMALLEMRARLIDRLGWGIGNQRALQIVTDAMKLDSASPTMVQARDSIIAADNAGFAGVDVPDIRSGFAVRGVGAGASVSGSTLLSVTESFFPSSVAGAITFSDSLGNNNGVAEPGEDLIFSIPLTNRLASADNNVAASLGNSSALYGDIAPAATVLRTFAYRVAADASCGNTLQIPFRVTSPNGVASIMVPVQVGLAVNSVSFFENFEGIAGPALPIGWSTATSGVANSAWGIVAAPVIDSGNCVFAADVSQASDSSLVSPIIALASGQRLSFKHRFTFQTPNDGGVLEIKIGAGSFTDIIAAGGSFAQGGYNASVSTTTTTSPLVGRRVWSGSIPTTNNVSIDLPPAAGGQNVQFRWRLGCDSSTASTGWNIDSVQIFSTSYNCASIDTDSDGMPDGWEAAHGLSPSDPLDAAGDNDGDGMTNLQEYLAGTDPNDPASQVHIQSIAQDTVAGASLGFSSVNGKLYRVEYSGDLTNPNGWQLLQDHVVGTGGVVPINDPNAAEQLLRFYRVVLEP